MFGGVGLPVDTAGIDLGQDGDTALSAAGDLGHGTREIRHSNTTACRRSYGGGPAATTLRRGQGRLPGLSPHSAAVGEVIDDPA